ncbi:MAG: MCE family protein [Opitutales bacterium]|nr:MCE family protein [Opitutales bacterium]
MKDALYAIRVGLFFALGLLLTYAVYLALSRKELHAGNGYTISALFTDMSTLSPNDDVRLAGVKIGRVTETNIQGGRGLAVMLIDAKYDAIPKDSVASISMGNLLGGNFVSIEYGNEQSGFLKDGDSLDTKPTASIEAVLSQLNELGRKLNVAADSFADIGEEPKSLFAKLNQIIDDNRSKIDNTLSNLESITTDVREGKGTIGKLIESSEAHDELLATVAEIKGAAEDARKLITEAQGTLDGLKTGEGAIGKLLYDKEAAQKIDNIISNFDEFSAALNSGEGTLGKLATDDELYRQLRALLSQAQQTLGSMSDSGPISAVGAAASGLF